MPEKIVTTQSGAVTSLIFGTCDENVKKIEDRFSVRISNGASTSPSEGDAIFICGDRSDRVSLAATVIEYLKRMLLDGDSLSEQSVDYVLSAVEAGEAEDLTSLKDAVCVTMKGKPIRPKTVGQKRYVDAIRKNTVTLGIGPAGTGKTFLAVAMAVDALRSKQISRIILTRPAVEAGEKLGFLPGDLQNKIDPYLRPLYDALHEMLGAENFQRQLERSTIEIAPLAYMRGRTLDDAFIILDEAQNTTCEQMKMFLTRLGTNSKAVVTGDPSQTDLPFGKKSGLGVAARVLKGIDGISIHAFSDRDVVRHHLVQKIINAYDRYEKEKRSETSRRNFTARREEKEK